MIRPDDYISAILEKYELHLDYKKLKSLKYDLISLSNSSVLNYIKKLQKGETETPEKINIEANPNITTEKLIKQIIASDDVSSYSKIMKIINTIKPNLWINIKNMEDPKDEYFFSEFFKQTEDIREIIFDKERGFQYFMIKGIE